MNTDPILSAIKKSEVQRAFYKNWYIKLIDPTTHQAFWLKFNVLSTSNGFRRIAEVWAIYFQKSNKEVKKVALKQTYPIESFLASDQTDIRIGDSELLPNRTRGSVTSKGNSIQWDLHLMPARESSIRFVPNILTKTKIIRNSIVTLCEEMLFSGTAIINGEIIQWKEAPGMQGYLDGSRNNHSWIWGHCNSFIDEQGNSSPFAFEGFSTRAKLGPFVIPRLSSFYFYYQGKHYHFKTLREALYIKSKHNLNEWTFQADRDDLSFRGYAKAEHKDFAGLTFEDTNGSYLYCTHSELAEMKIHVYRKGKLEATLTSPGTAGFEIVSREKNPYVPLLI